jgi:type IX secretion system PorP/SprF family membrane protein
MLIFIKMNGQDVHFSQFYANHLYLNPALTGSSICPRFFANYRNQWASMPKSYITYSTSYDQYSEALHGGFGFMALNDVQGDGLLNTVQFSGLYSYSARISNKSHLKFGFQTGIVHRYLNWDKVVLADMLDPITGMVSLPTGEVKPDDLHRFFVDFSTGVALYGQNYYLGMAAHHINSSGGLTEKKTSAFFPHRYTFHIGTEISMFKRGRKKQKLDLSPNLVIQHQQNSTQINYGLFLARKLHYEIIIGTWLRQDLELNINSFVYLIGFVYKNYKFAYSYDVNKNKLSQNVLNSHEISLHLRMRCNKKMNEKHYSIKCPQF